MKHRVREARRSPWVPSQSAESRLVNGKRGYKRVTAVGRLPGADLAWEGEALDGPIEFGQRFRVASLMQLEFGLRVAREDTATQTWAHHHPVEVLQHQRKPTSVKSSNNAKGT